MRIVYIYEGRTRKGIGGCAAGEWSVASGGRGGLVLQETLTRFGLNSHHQRDLEVKGSEGPPAVEQRLPAIR